MAAAPNIRRRLPLFLMACLLATAAAQAADKAGKAASAPAARTRLLTPAELRECKAQEARVLALTDEARAEKAGIEDEKAEIGRLGTSLADEVATLDKTSAEAVDAYNAKVEARDKRIDAYQARVAAFNAKAEAVNSSRDGYAKACDQRRYDERDLEDIKRKK
jgi:hypothetical protein